MSKKKTKKPKTKRTPRKGKSGPAKKKPARRARISDEDMRRHRLTSTLDELQEQVDQDAIEGFIIVTIGANPDNDGIRITNDLPLARAQYLLCLAERYNMDRAMQASKQTGQG